MINGDCLKGYHGLVQITDGYEVCDSYGKRVGLYLKRRVAEHFAAVAGHTLHQRPMAMIESAGEKAVVLIDNRRSLTLLGVHEYAEVSDIGYHGLADINVGYELVGNSGPIKWRLAIFKHHYDAEREQVRHSGSSVRKRIVMVVGNGSRKSLYILDSPLVKDFQGYQLKPRFTRVDEVSSKFISSLNRAS